MTAGSSTRNISRSSILDGVAENVESKETSLVRFAINDKLDKSMTALHDKWLNVQEMLQKSKIPDDESSWNYMQQVS